jgi:hypothetical protein
VQRIFQREDFTMSKKSPAQWIVNHPELNDGDFGPIIRTDAEGDNAQEFTSVNEACGNASLDACKVREKLRSIFLPNAALDIAFSTKTIGIIGRTAHGTIISVD